MQKQIVLFVALLLASTITLFAGNPSSSALTVDLEKSQAPGKMHLQISGLGHHNTDVVVQDLSGKTWFSILVKKTDRFVRELDVQNLPAATYILVVRNKQEQKNRVFRLDQLGAVVLETSEQPQAKGGLLLDAGGERKVVVRISSVDAETIWVHLSNLQEYRATLQLVSDKGETRWEESLAGQPAFGNTIDLGALTLEPGLYFLCLNAGNATLMQELTVQANGVKTLIAHHTAHVPASPAMAKNK